MTTGTGLAIMGVWLFMGICSASRHLTGLGWMIALAATMIVTAKLI